MPEQELPSLNETPAPAGSCVLHPPLYSGRNEPRSYGLAAARREGPRSPP